MFKLPGCYAKSALLVGVLVSVMATLFAGCGQNGPLYHADESAQQAGQHNGSPAKRKKSPFQRIPAPQSQKHDQAQRNPSPTDSSQKGDSTSTPPGDTPPAADPDRPADPTPVPTP